MAESVSFGAYLKAQREKKGIRLEEIASITKIHLRNLQYLEAGDWKHLPPDPFLRGFIVAYAKYIGLDPKEAVQELLKEIQPAASQEDLTNEAAPVAVEQPKKVASLRSGTPSALIDTPKTLPYKKIFGSIGAAAVVAIFVFITKVGQDSSEVKSTEVPVVAENGTKESVVESGVAPIPEKVEAPAENREVASPKVETPAPVAAAPTATPAPVAPPADILHEVVIEGKERTWIKVVFDKEPAVEYFLPEGEKVTYRAKEKIKVVLGNSTGTRVVHNGTASPGTKLQGTIRQYLFPDNARFPQDVPSKRIPTSGTANPAKAPTANPPPTATEGEAAPQEERNSPSLR